MNSHQNLIASMSYLEQVIHLRLGQYFDQKKTANSIELPGFQFEESEDTFTQFMVHCQLSIEEFIVLLLALAPHIQSSFFEDIVGEYLVENGDLPVFGGAKGKDYRFMLPTVETALFLLAGKDLHRRLELLEIFDDEHFLLKNRIIRLEQYEPEEPKSSARLHIDPEMVELFTKGRISIPQLSSQFPAQRLQTEQEWDNLVLPADTHSQLKEIEIWLRHNESIMEQWGLGKKLKPGYRALFYGPPGTGKTLAASLIGKYTGREVFRVDLSKIISKYIGETEKNLANFFDKAEHKNWCIFFDEADACFGKRTSVKDSKDRYANQEVAYLLQRIEEYPGLVIMASNFKNNIDKAFIRRFNSIVYFPLPKAEERKHIWQNAFPEKIEIENKELLDRIAKEYELSGANIMNVVQYACLQTLSEGADVIREEIIMKGVKREYKKENKAF